jgi:hypothetical protein
MWVCLFESIVQHCCQHGRGCLLGDGVLVAAAHVCRLRHHANEATRHGSKLAGVHARSSAANEVIAAFHCLCACPIRQQLPFARSRLATPIRSTATPAHARPTPGAHSVHARGFYLLDCCTAVVIGSAELIVAASPTLCAVCFSKPLLGEGAPLGVHESVPKSDGLHLRGLHRGHAASDISRRGNVSSSPLSAVYLSSACAGGACYDALAPCLPVHCVHDSLQPEYHHGTNRSHARTSKSTRK